VTYLFVDCRFEVLDPAAGERLYLEGHIPGAVFLDVDRDLSDLARAPHEGRHPLPSADAFADVASRAGIGPGTFVVAYDQGMTGGAARLWWLLRHFGHDDVAVLEGGIGAWLGPLHGGREVARPAVFVPRERADDTIEAEELVARLDDPALTIVDARGAARFRGDESPGDPLATLDPVAGHVPGAINAPFPEPALPEPVLAADELAVYCGSGVTAAVSLLRLAQAGRADARLYPGSWSEWSRRGLPAETGDR
jgi:thiosulfate/3-mercaptopyruvate sulfurtransferase